MRLINRIIFDDSTGDYPRCYINLDSTFWINDKQNVNFEEDGEGFGLE